MKSHRCGQGRVCVGSLKRLSSIDPKVKSNISSSSMETKYSNEEIMPNEIYINIINFLKNMPVGINSKFPVLLHSIIRNFIYKGIHKHSTNHQEI